MNMNAPTPQLMREARAIYAERPSHYSEIKPDDERERGCVCAIEACNAVGVECLDFKFFLGVNSLSMWNATHTTEEVLAEWDRYIASLETAVA